jgi:hypothetical protein
MPVMARSQIREVARHVPTLHLLAQHRFAMFIDPMHLKNALCQIDSNRRNLHGDAPFRLSGRIALPLWHFDAVSERGRPSH